MTVQGPVKEQPPDGTSQGGPHGGGWWTTGAMGGGRGQQATAAQPPAAQPARPPVRRLRGSADALTAPAGTPAAAAVGTQRPDQREERVTVQGPVKKQQPDGMSHTVPPALGPHTNHHPTPPLKRLDQIFLRAFGRSTIFSGPFGASKETQHRWGGGRPSRNASCARATHGVGERMGWTAGTTRGGVGHLGPTHTETRRGRWWAT